MPGIASQKTMSASSELDERFRLASRKNARASSVLLLLYEMQGRIHFPLMQRPIYDGVHSGQISLPGGKMEPEDDSLEATALRETEEEIGVDRSSITIIGSLTDLFVPVSNFIIQPIVGVTNQQPSFIPEPLEVENVIEADLHKLIESKPSSKVIVVKRAGTAGTRSYNIDAPYFDVDGNTVWGATAMLLAEFIAVCNEYKNFN